MAINVNTLAVATPTTGEIRSETELDKATKELCDLLFLGRALSADEGRRFRSLTDAVEKYESVHHPIPD